MKNLFIVFNAWVMMVLIACGGPMAPIKISSNFEEPSGPSGESPIPTHPPSKSQIRACYSGNTQEECFLTYSDQIVMEQSDEYHYFDPFTDPNFPRGFPPEHYEAPIRFVEALKVFSERYLSLNYKFGELIQERKGPYGLVSKIALMQMQDISDQLNEAVIVNSGYRSPKYNNSVGGALWSRHMYGDAFDFYSPEVSLSELKVLCEKQGASFIQLYSSHIHCDWRNGEKDPSFFAIGNALSESSKIKNIYKTMAEQTKVTINYLPSEQRFQISVDFPFQEDPGELAMKWNIVQENQSFQRVGKSILLKPEIYKIKVSLGDSVHKVISLDLR